MTFKLSTMTARISFSLMGFLLFSGVCMASDDGSQCAGRPDNGERLACYDALNAARLQESQSLAVERSYLTRSWDLDNKDEEMLGERQSPLRPHHPSYLIVRKSSETNQQPYSPSHGSSTLPVVLEPTEIKFQISQKARVLNSVKMDFLGITSFRMWGGYTQQSNWQAFDSGNSSPFRETNYEPELIATLGTGNKHGLKLINLGYVHQSNGRNSLFSRSWNRVYLQAGWETDTLSLLVRGWWRIPENYAEDDNPDIGDYIGRGDVTLRWEPLDGSQVIDLTLRNNLRSDSNHGFIQMDWATPISVSKSTKLHIQFSSGYGESLIDYNFKQTTLGLGVSFRDW
jgi:phospholipase A1/A2